MSDDYTLKIKDHYSEGDRNGQESGVLTIPLSKYIPKTGPRKDLTKRNNFADNKETVKKTLAFVQNYKQTIEAQGMRIKAIEDMDCFDEMFRVAKTAEQIKADERRNIDPTQSKITSTSFYDGIRTITTGEQAVILGNTEDLPVVYEPVPGATDYRQVEARKIADSQNAVLEYCWEKDGMRSKVSDILFFGAKYGTLLMVMDWDRLVEERTEIVPKRSMLDTLREKLTGKPSMPSKFTAETKRRNVKNNPTVKWYDMGRSWFDTTILGSAQNHSFIMYRDQVQLPGIYGMQASGEWMNADKITAGTLYNDDFGGQTETVRDRKTNAGVSDDTSSVNILFDTYTAWIRLPVNVETGKWEPDKNIQTWFKTVWCGDVNASPVCLQLEPDMHWSKKIPAEFFHTHRDDSGAVSIAYGNLMKSLYAMECTLLSEAMDNTRLLCRKPWVLERGSITIAKKTFTAGGNEVWWKRSGDKDPTELKVESTAQIIVSMLDRVQDRAKQAMGTNKILNGENLGSRTSASEAGNVYQQALQPALEDAKFKANQILPFIASWCLEMTRQFADPEETYFVTHGEQIIEVKPSQLWGNLSVRITAIKRFSDSILRRHEEDQFLNQIYPMMKDLMSPKGKVQFFTSISKNRGFEDVESWFALAPTSDAQNWASAENQQMMQGIPMMPKQGEDHATHLKVHKAFMDAVSVMPQEQINPQSSQLLQQHIQATEQLEAAGASGAGVAPPGQGLGTAEPGGPHAPSVNPSAAPAMPGEIAGDMTAGGFGSMGG